MKDTFTTFERRLEMLFLISNCSETTQEKLSEYFSVSRRTIVKDISALSRYAPIYTKSGMFGGIFVIDGWKPNLFLPLSADEENFLIELSRKLDTTGVHHINNILCKYSKNKVHI